MDYKYKNARFFDIISKKEMNINNLQPNIPYIVMFEDWKIRVIQIDKNGNIQKEEYISKEHEIRAKMEIMKQSLIEQGMHNIGIDYCDSINLDNI